MTSQKSLSRWCLPSIILWEGVWADLDSRTSMEHLYAVGETSCNGVHGKNRLASNSLLESLVFAGKAAKRIENSQKGRIHYESNYHAAYC